MVRLGVNIDHIATLREVRKAKYPDLLEAANLCVQGGAHQITVHLREDRRHIQDADVLNLLKWGKLPVNLEMAFVSEIIEKAIKWKPHSVTLVPERRAEMTTESGLNLREVEKNPKALESLRKSTIVYGFIDPEIEQVEIAKKLDIRGVEFHTGPYAHACDRGNDSQELNRLMSAAKRASELGLEVKAGHGLTVANVKPLLKMPGISEMNIGHSIVARAVMIGLEAAVREMVRAIGT